MNIFIISDNKIILNIDDVETRSLELIAAIRQQHREIPILVYSRRDITDLVVSEVLSHGASGYINKGGNYRTTHCGS